MKRSSPITAENTMETPKADYFQLRLYVAGQTPKSLQAFANLKKICEDHLKGKYDIEVIDPPDLLSGKDR